MTALSKKLLTWRVSNGRLTQQQAADRAMTKRQYWNFCENGRFDSVPYADKRRIAITIGEIPLDFWGTLLLTPGKRRKLNITVRIIEDSDD